MNMHIEVLASIGTKRFMVKWEGSCYVVSLATNVALEVKDVESVYRQGYWSPWEQKSDKSLVDTLYNILTHTK